MTWPRTSLAEKIKARCKEGPAPDHAPELGPCLLWTGYVNPISGYGTLTVRPQGCKSKTHWAHVLAWTLQNGPVPPGMMVDHRCHVKLCMRTSHMRLATRKQNAENMRGARKDSSSGLRGVREENPGRWRPTVTHHGVHHRGPLFPDKHEAARWAQQKRLELFTHNDEDRRT